MLYRDRESQEGYIHICDNANSFLKEYIKNRPQVYLHDVKSYMLIDGEMVSVKFCPYCGKKISDEIENASNEFYKF